MDAIEAIMTRRSVRRFTSQEIEEEKIETILKAAMSAPSAGGCQPWHFIVIKKREILNKIPNIHPYASMCKEANLAIVPCVDPALEKYKGFWVEDLSAATQNILLSIRALGLGAVWVGVYPSEEKVKRIRELLEIPEAIIPFCIIPLGYSDTEQKTIDRFQKDRVHWDNW